MSGGGLAVDTGLNASSFFEAVTPSDDTVLTGVRALYVGSMGTVVATNSNGVDVSFECPAGVTLQISPVKVKAATDADDIVALY